MPTFYFTATPTKTLGNYPFFRCWTSRKNLHHCSEVLQKKQNTLQRLPILTVYKAEKTKILQTKKPI
jgi:hypothetical protein